MFADSEAKPISGRTLFLTGMVLSCIGVIPLLFAFVWNSTHDFEPLSVPVTLQQGKYTSPLFRTDLSDTYQVEIYLVPYDRSPVEIAWRVADASNDTMGKGRFREQTGGGNDIVLTQQYLRKGFRGRVQLDVKQGISGATKDTKLHVDLPDRGLAFAEGLLPLLLLWLALFLSVGLTLMLASLVIELRRILKHPSSAAPR